MSNYTNWEDLKQAVGKWALANFGSQHGIGCLAPLMGLAEEAGEWYVADTREEVEDALGDIAIFLMDYCNRAGIDLSVMPLTGYVEEDRTGEASLGSSIGQLFHCQLKRIQRIRGMENWDAFVEKRYQCVGEIIYELEYQCPGCFELACDVFERVVKKRKWHEVPDAPMTLNSCLRDFAEIALELNPVERPNV